MGVLDIRGYNVSNMQDLFTIILTLVLTLGGIYIGYKTENLGKDKKYNRKR